MRPSSAPRTVFAVAAVLAGGAFALPFPPARLSAQAVEVSLAPTIQRIQWHRDLALDDDWMYGGRLLLRFGPWLELQPFYFTQDGVTVDSSRALERLGTLAVGRSLDVRHYGTSLQFNLARGHTVPFARAGAGVLRLKPDSGTRQDRIALSVGGGLRFGVGGVNAEVFAEQLSFRLSSRSLFGTDTSGGEVPTLRNVVYGATVTVPIARGGGDATEGLFGSSVPIEPFVGRLDFAGSLDLADQELIGIRTGFDLSPIAGLRGFYWRGVNDDRDGPSKRSAYGGEAQFNLNTGPGVSPFLTIGAGRVVHGRSSTDSLGIDTPDRTAFIIGGGLSLAIADRVRLNGSIRDYMMTDDRRLGDIASTADLTHSTLISAGFTVSVGGSAGRDAADGPARARAPRWTMAGRDGPDADETPLERERRLRRALEMARDERADSIERDDRLARRERLALDSLEERSLQRERMMRAMHDTAARADRWITVPVPTVGEVILRYGLPPVLDTGPRVRTMRDSGMRDSARPAGVTPEVMRMRVDSVDRIALLERRLSDRLDSIQVQLARELRAERERAATPAVVVATPTPAVTPLPVTSVATVDTVAAPLSRRLRGLSVRDLQPYAGIGADDDDDIRLVAGLRADLGPVQPGSSFRYVPELAVGIGEGPLSVLALLNVRFTFGDLAADATPRLLPYVSLGGGINSPTVLAVSTAVGSSILIGDREAGRQPLRLHIELQGLNLFRETRLLFSFDRSGGVR